MSRRGVNLIVNEHIESIWMSADQFKTPHPKVEDDGSEGHSVYWKVSPPSELLLRKLQKASQEDSDVNNLLELLERSKKNTPSKVKQTCGAPASSIAQSTPIKNFVSSFNFAQSPTPTKSNGELRRPPFDVRTTRLPLTDLNRPNKRPRIQEDGNIPGRIIGSNKENLLHRKPSNKHVLERAASGGLQKPLQRTTNLPRATSLPISAIPNGSFKHSAPPHNANDFSEGSDEYKDLDDILFDDNSLESLLSQYDHMSTIKSTPIKKKAINGKDLPGLEELVGIDLSVFSDDMEEVMGSTLVKMNDKTIAEANQVHRLQAADVIELDDVKILLGKKEGDSLDYYVHLQHDWMVTDVKIGDVFNVIGEFNIDRKCIIDCTNNYLILHPDTLISSTHVADGVRCLRKAVLGDRIKSVTDYSPDLIYGNILHEMFQLSFMENDFSTSFVASQIDGVVTKYLEMLYCVDVEVDEAKAHVTEQFTAFRDWASKYITIEPRDGHVTDHRGTDRDRPTIAITKLLDIEEHIWSPRFGLKGMVDATVQIKMIERGEAEKTVVVPLELKTGRNATVLAHRAQTILYTLLMSDRYELQIDSGLLYYLRLNEVIRVPAVRNEVRALIQARNHLAFYMKTRNEIPEMLKHEHECKRCYAKDACMLYHKALERGTAESSGVPDLFSEKTINMTARDADFLRHWDSLLALEEGDMYAYRKEIWSMSSNEREAAGRCFANMKVADLENLAMLSSSKVRRYNYKFVKSDIETSQRASLLGSQINVGDPIVVSSETGQYALALGFVTILHGSYVWLSLDRKLTLSRERMSGFDALTNQDFCGIMEVNDGTRPSRVEEKFSRIIFRIDKDELTSGMSLVRNNLLELFRVNGDIKRRDLVVELRKPVFYKEAKIKSDTSQLNENQIHAMEKVLAAQDYALIHGMPGTGKTTTIASIIDYLVKEGKSILLTSYTHSAVDNILLKLKPLKIKMLRLGTRDKVHPDIVQYIANGDGKIKTIKALQDLVESVSVIATTCLGINHLLLSKKRFDYCIVDEASQVTLPVCLGPLRFAKKFVLVGDHHQLPPLVRNAAAQKDGLGDSLFKRLGEAHPEAKVNLSFQYRMNEDIMSLANTIMYKNQLKCGSNRVATRELLIPKSHQVKLHATKSNACAGRLDCWIERILLPSSKVIFINTDQVPAIEARSNNNPIEASMLVQAVRALIMAGVAELDIGVLSLYRSQLRSMANMLSDYPEVEILTADRYQGRDKECILVSFVRSNDAGDVGELLRDARRVNVALTRAKSKLVMFGSKRTLVHDKVLSDMIRLIESRGWMMTPPKDADTMHSELISVKGLSGQIGRRTSPKKQHKVIDGKNTAARLANRPVLRDILNVI